MKKLDVAFLHPPVRLEQKQGLNQMIFIPTGVFSLAAYAQQYGFEPKIFNSLSLIIPFVSEVSGIAIIKISISFKKS